VLYRNTLILMLVTAAPFLMAWVDKPHGFIDVRAGVRTSDDPLEDDLSLGESRLQLDFNHLGQSIEFQFTADLLYDDVALEHDINLETGKGWLDIRQASLLFSPNPMMDMKVGRQILTWGTGDLVFINDLFPKDWQSFFSGRDETYLKAPSDAIFISWFPSIANMDLAYTPRFDADRYISGERLSYWSPFAGDFVGQNAIIQPTTPDQWFSDDELALRISRNIKGYEGALYVYNGFWKSPSGLDPARMQPDFPQLRVYGASVRGSLGKGLVNGEIGYYHSPQSKNGTDPTAPNSEWRFLLGYEFELARELTAGFQYYGEQLQDYSAYRQTLQEGQPARDETRSLFTMRLTKMAMNQNLVLSLFSFYSPTDNDSYIRPVFKYKVNDNWLVTGGGNFFQGQDDHTFFARFQNNNNLYAGVRYSF